MIKLPQLVKVVCHNCETQDEVYWGQYGAEQACDNCDAPPICLVKVGA